MAGEHTHSGNPYRGLASFDVKHANLFVGREALVARAIDKLQSKAQEHKPFLLILGKSGAGKDSLLQAGILPALNQSQSFPGVNQFLYTFVKPADLGQDPIKGLVSSFTTATCGEIFDSSEVRELTHLCKEKPQQFIALLKQKLNDLPTGVRLVLGVKQLEQSFVGDDVSQTHRQVFSDLLARLATELGIFVIVTMRSDYYHFLTEMPALMELKKQRGQLDVGPPSNAELLAMIQRPAMMSSVQFEVGKEGMPSLDLTLAERAEEFPNGLALLQFSLQKLYETQSRNGILNHASYRKIGGLERAISNHAEYVYESLERKHRKHFTRTFTRLAKKSHTGGFERVWVISDELMISERANHLVQSYLDAGLLISEVNADGLVTIAIIHNCVIDHWSRLKECLESNQKLLMLKENMESQAQQWQTATRPSAYLLLPGKALEEGKLLLKHGGKLHPSVKALIKASLKRVTRNRRIKILGALGVLVLLGFTINNAFNSKLEMRSVQAKLEESHKLIEFLIDDERRQLEPMGLLDVMEEGSERSYQYFRSLGPDDASGNGKRSRSRTFFNIGKVQLEIGNYDAALEAFEQTLILNNELVEVNPNGYEFRAELAQTLYWKATTFLKAGNTDQALQHFQSYQKTAFDLVKLKPDSEEAKIELARAYSSMASIAASRQQKELAMQLYLETIKFSEGRVSKKEDIQLLIQAYDWLENKYKSELKLQEAIEMSQGELIAKNRLVELDNTPETVLSASLSTWSEISNLMLVGKNTVATNKLLKLRAESALMSERYPEQHVWKYLEAFSLSRLAQINLVAGRGEEGKSQLIESFLILEEPNSQAASTWFDAYFERQYWNIRMLYQVEPDSSTLEAENLLVSAEREEAKNWQIRLMSLQKSTTNIPNEEELRELSDPQSLITYIEQAAHSADEKKLVLLRGLVPQEMWSNPDLARLRPQIRKVLND